LSRCIHSSFERRKSASRSMALPPAEQSGGPPRPEASPPPHRAAYPECPSFGAAGAPHTAPCCHTSMLPQQLAHACRGGPTGGAARAHAVPPLRSPRWGGQARPGRSSALSIPSRFPMKSPFRMGLLCWRAGRLNTENGGFRPGQLCEGAAGRTVRTRPFGLWRPPGERPGDRAAACTTIRGPAASDRRSVSVL
jgi:hypothetical protein